MTTRDWWDLTTEDFAGLDGDRLVAVQPVCAVEQHGPHLPVRVDAAINAGILHRALQLIPAKLPDEAQASGANAPKSFAVNEYEPSEGEILGFLLKRNISTQIFRGLLENAASEQGSRMTAMDNATRNAGDMIGALTLIKNRTRQSQITKELIEIISGAEAL